MTLPANARPWQAAFVAFCNGAPEEEISQIFNIPFLSLINRMQVERWAELRAKLPLATNPGGAPAITDNSAAKLELINQNRQQNLKAFVELRDHAIEVVTALREGRLKVKTRVKGVTTETDPTPNDWLTIATYLRTISEGTYRALGDFQSRERAIQDAPAGTPTPSAPAITIILPGPVAAPREMRHINPQVIDCTEFKAEITPIPN